MKLHLHKKVTPALRAQYEDFSVFLSSFNHIVYLRSKKKIASRSSLQVYIACFLPTYKIKTGRFTNNDIVMFICKKYSNKTIFIY